MTMTTLIQQGESATLEFKQSFDKEAIETVCAFANAKVERLKTYNSTLKIQKTVTTSKNKPQKTMAV